MYNQYHSMVSFPRRDYTYQKDRSLNFDLLRTKVYKDRELPYQANIMEWVAYAMVGITVGFVAACATQVEHHIIYYRKAYADSLIGAEES